MNLARTSIFNFLIDKLIEFASIIYRRSREKSKKEEEVPLHGREQPGHDVALLQIPAFAAEVAAPVPG